MLNRRQFMRLSGLTLLLANGSALAGVMRAMRYTRNPFGRQTLEQLLNTRFEADSDTTSMTLELVSVDVHPYSKQLDQYSLIFASSDGNAPDGLYDVRHASIRSVSGRMYIVPSEQEQPGHYYRAVFSQFA